MKQNPMIVNYIDWDIVLKCKNTKYNSMDECLKSIWTEEYANPIKEYNTIEMLNIMGQVIEAVVPIKQRAFLLDQILRNKRQITSTELLRRLYTYLQFLQIRESDGPMFSSRHYDLYIIECNGRYYTIAQYDELKEENANA